MNVIIPQFIKSADFSEVDKNEYSELISVEELSITGEYGEIGYAETVTNTYADPTSDIYSASSTYATDDEVYYLPVAGDRDEGVWKKYKSLIDDNTGNTPPEYGSDSNWLDLGTIEQYKPFDYYVGTVISSTEDALRITFKSAWVSSLAILKTQAKKALVRTWNESSPGTYLEVNEFDLVESATNIWDYFFGGFKYTRNISIQSLSNLYKNLVVEVTLYKIGSLPIECGAIIPGVSYNIGMMQFGASTGIQDYSRKTTDQYFGETYLIVGNYKDTLDGTLLFETEYKNDINSIFRRLRATPTIWDANQYDSQFSDLMVYGYCDDFSIIHQSANHCEANLTIIGLI